MKLYKHVYLLIRPFFPDALLRPELREGKDVTLVITQGWWDTEYLLTAEGTSAYQQLVAVMSLKGSNAPIEHQ